MAEFKKFPGSTLLTCGCPVQYVHSDGPSGREVVERILLVQQDGSTLHRICGRVSSPVGHQHPEPKEVTLVLEEVS